MYQINKESGIVNLGNLSRIKSVMCRAEAGETLTLGFLGGSITQGSLASNPALCYAYRVFEWWQKTFPKAEFTYVNAGIGGTTSHFGAARVEEDLLAQKPDFVITEYSVNDESNDHFFETYEGLVRRIMKSDTHPALMLVHNVRYDNGANAQLVHARVGRHYDLPCVSMQSSIYPEVLAGRIDNRAITPDDLHPNDAGHELVASVITYFLEQVRAMPDVPKKELPLAQPLTANTYEGAVRYQNYNCIPQGHGFVRDEAQQNGITDCFKNGWTMTETGVKMVFDLEGCGFAVQYRQSVKLPAPVAVAYVDGDREHSVVLDANFDETWGDNLEITTITEHMDFGRHTVTVELTETHDNDAVPFYLVSVIAAK